MPNLTIALRVLDTDPTGNIVATIAGALPTGCVAVFTASRVPVREAGQVIPGLVQGNTAMYSLTLPYRFAVWYVWVAVKETATGQTSAWSPSPLAVLSSKTDALALDVARAVEGVLQANQSGIEAYLRTHYKETTLKYIQYGYGGDIDRYPAIIVAQPKWTRTLVGLPVTYEYRFSSTIACLLAVTNDEGDMLEPATSFATGVGQILNNPYYRRIDTPGGAGLYECESRDGAAEEVLVADSRYVATATLSWTCQCLITEGK